MLEGGVDQAQIPAEFLTDVIVCQTDQLGLEAVPVEARIPAQIVAAEPRNGASLDPVGIRCLGLHPARSLGAEPRRFVVDPNRVHIVPARVPVLDRQDVVASGELPVDEAVQPIRDIQNKWVIKKYHKTEAT